MATPTSIKIKDVAITRLHEFEGNPQEQDPATFNNLIQEIEEDGFDEPLVVIPAPDKGKGHYRVVSGNHRLRAVKVLDFEIVPCIVKKNWDDLQAKIKLVRRNMLKGELNPERFTHLVNELSTAAQIDQEVLADMMGFVTFDQFLRVYEQEKEGERIATEKQINDVKDEMRSIDNLSMLLNQLFNEFGDTVSQSYMAFFYGKKLHVMVEMNPTTKQKMEIISRRCIEEGLDINTILASVLSIGLKASGLQDGPFDDDVLEEAASEVEEDSDLDADAFKYSDEN